jgi:outer membrane protein W
MLRGARCNDAMLADSLFVGMYAYAVKIDTTMSLKGIHKKIEKMQESKRIKPWRWIFVYCRNLK